MMRWIVICAILAVVMGLAGCAGSRESLAEREIERRAPDYIGPADDYDVDVRGLTENSAEQITVVGSRVRPTPGLVIDALTLNLREVRYQRQPFRVLSIEQATFTARVTDDAANDYLRAQQRTGAGSLQNVQVAFAPDQVRASGSLVTASGTVAVTTTGAMIPQGQAVLYQPQTIALGGVPVPEGLLPQFAALVNPLIDLRTLRFSPQVAQITLVDGAVILTGTADARALLNGTPASSR